MYQALDYFFISLHTLVIFFNLFGWMFRKTRKANLILLLLTGGSWFILGIWKGLGYCPLTDWHYDVLRKLGETNLPNSYIKYIADRITGLNFNSRLVDVLVLVLFLIALITSVYLNIKDFKQKRAF